MQQKEILDVKNITVTLNRDKIISDLSFKVYKQDVLAILGPNGAGKTTLLRTLLGLIPHQGSITWSTKKISYLPPQELLGKTELPPITIQDFFSFKNAAQNQTIAMLEQVGLSESILKKQFNRLSTGQFQRMIIAWSLIDNPEVLLFDEPSSGIDIGGEETIYSLLHKLWKEKKLTIILVTHDLSIVWRHANNVLCLNKKKLCMGPPSDVLSTENLKKLYQTDINFYKHEH